MDPGRDKARAQVCSGLCVYPIELLPSFLGLLFLLLEWILTINRRHYHILPGLFTGCQEEPSTREC